jgi:hypothetical protein
MLSTVHYRCYSVLHSQQVSLKGRTPFARSGPTIHGNVVRPLCHVEEQREERNFKTWCRLNTWLRRPAHIPERTVGGSTHIPTYTHTKTHTYPSAYVAQIHTYTGTVLTYPRGGVGRQTPICCRDLLPI